MAADGGDHSEYERREMEAIAEWKREEPGIVSKAFGIVAAPAVWLVKLVVPDAAVKGALQAANWVANSLADSADICRDGGVSSAAELRQGDLERCDRLADGVRSWAIRLATVEGVATGATGLPGLALDVPAVITLALRTVHKTGICYGYECKSEQDQNFAFGVLSASGANSMNEKLTALTTLRTIEVALAKQTWKAMAEKAATNQMSKEAGIIGVRTLAKQLGVNLTKRKALQAIPLIGAAVGASANGWFIREVAWAARRSFQERWLKDNDRFVES
jgi:hypothetical protein